MQLPTFTGQHTSYRVWVRTRYCGYTSTSTYTSSSERDSGSRTINIYDPSITSFAPSQSVRYTQGYTLTVQGSSFGTTEWTVSCAPTPVLCLADACRPMLLALVQRSHSASFGGVLDLRVHRGQLCLHS